MIIGFDGNFDKLNPPRPDTIGERFYGADFGLCTQRRNTAEVKKNGARMVVKNGHFLKLIRNEDIYETKPNKQHPNS